MEGGDKIRFRRNFSLLVFPLLLASCSNLAPRADGAASSAAGTPRVVPRSMILLDEKPLSSANWEKIELSENQDASIPFDGTTRRVFLIKYNSSDVSVSASETGYVYGDGGAAGVRALLEPADDFTALTSKAARPDGIPWRSDFPPAIEFYERLKGGAPAASGAARAADAAVHAARAELTAADTGSEASFWTIENNQSKLQKAELKAVGTHCAVWFIDSATAAAEDAIDFQSVADKFDTIYELETGVFGSPQYTADEMHSETKDTFILPDSGGRIAILLLDIDADAQQQNSSVVMGYFYSADMLVPSAAKSYQVETNNRELIYIDSYCMAQYPEAAYATLAHEFQHLLNFVQKTVRHGVYSETWYNEMLSMVCEDMMTGVLNIRQEDGPISRLSLFNCSANLGFTSWRTGDDVLQSYANSYAFGAYLARNFGGVDFIKEIAMNSSVNEASIEEALSAAGYDGETFQSAAGKFAQCAAFTKPPAESRFMSLNRSESEGQLRFPPVDLERFSVRLSSGSRYSGPFIYIAAKEGGQVKLDPHGFSVHYVGTGLSSMTIRAPASDAVECYLLYETE